MDKETFCKYLKIAERYLQQADNASKALEAFTDGGAIFTLGDELFDNFIILLGESVGDENGDTISWWLFDAPKNEKVVFVGTYGEEEQKKYNLATEEDLYDFLTTV
ncbi:MAG: hypothetical protein ACI37Z_10465 [Candidatus Gastranaerophilaceae bacterium]